MIRLYTPKKDCGKAFTAFPQSFLRIILSYHLISSFQDCAIAVKQVLPFTVRTNPQGAASDEMIR